MCWWTNLSHFFILIQSLIFCYLRRTTKNYFLIHASRVFYIPLPIFVNFENEALLFQSITLPVTSQKSSMDVFQLGTFWRYLNITTRPHHHLALNFLTIDLYVDVLRKLRKFICPFKNNITLIKDVGAIKLSTRCSTESHKRNKYYLR